MSTPEQPDTPQLTRKQLREIRNTGLIPIIDSASNPVITAEEVPVSARETTPRLHHHRSRSPSRPLRSRRPPFRSPEPPNRCCCLSLLPQIGPSTSASHR